MRYSYLLIFALMVALVFLNTYGRNQKELTKENTEVAAFLLNEHDLDLDAVETESSQMTSIPTSEITDPPGTLAGAIKCVEASKIAVDKLLDEMLGEWGNIKDHTYKGVQAENARSGLNILIKESYWMLSIGEICEEGGEKALELMEVN
jgi:hypothetical protein